MLEGDKTERLRRMIKQEIRKHSDWAHDGTQMELFWWHGMCYAQPSSVFGGKWVYWQEGWPFKGMSGPHGALND